MRSRLLAPAAFTLLVSACSGSPSAGVPIVDDAPISTTSTSTTTPANLPSLKRLKLELVTDELTEPVAIAAAPSLDEVFVVERAGRIVRLAEGAPRVVLDITDKIESGVVEQGLLGLALHPEFPTDPRAFAIYTDTDEDVIASSFLWVEGVGFDPATEAQLFEVKQPHYYHQGGGMAFGPEGFLWMSFGDGGGQRDKYKNGQDTDTLQGSVVRVSVDHQQPYAVPASNPFAANDKGAREIWAYGLRNPWRFTIDGDLIIISDVGQEGQEEINVSRLSEAGKNFGWPIMEGTECLKDEDCDQGGLTLPELTVDGDDGCAIIGGPVYRGSAIPELYGHYLFGDFCSGWVRSAPVEDGGLGEVVEWFDSAGSVSTFGTDTEGEILIASFDGRLFRVVAER